jgi:hypothetical protein
VLTLSAFPDHAQRGAVSQDTLSSMALIYLPIYVALFIAAMFAIAKFGINRQIHEENVRILTERSTAQPKGAGDDG